MTRHPTKRAVKGVMRYLLIDTYDNDIIGKYATLDDARAALDRVSHCSSTIVIATVLL